MLRSILLSLCVAALVSHAHAQQVAVDPTPINNAGPRLTQELLELERGGTAQVAFTIKTSGDVTDVVLQSSSGVPAFDELAVAAVKEWTFQPARDSSYVAVEVKSVVPIGFRTPSEVQSGVASHLSSQLGKTCFQFLSDVAAANATKPEDLPKAVSSFKELWTAAFGSLLVSGDKPSVIVAMVKAEKAVFDSVVSSCSANPESSYGDQFKASLQHQLSVARAES